MLLIRTLHKWFGMILGLQFLLWTVSGAMMALLDHHKVSGEHTVRAPVALAAPTKLVPIGELATLVGAPIQSVKLRPLNDRYVYEAKTSAGTSMLDAATGRPVVIDAVAARGLADAAYVGDGKITAVEPVTKHGLETRGLVLPLWKASFNDADNTALYVAAATGEVVERRTDTWRLWDVFWMLHIMDYSNRTSFNHPLIITVATGVAWLALSGVILLFRSFRRSDFAWALDGLDRLRSR